MNEFNRVIVGLFTLAPIVGLLLLPLGLRLILSRHHGKAT